MGRKWLPTLSTHMVQSLIKNLDKWATLKLIDEGWAEKEAQNQMY